MKIVYLFDGTPFIAELNSEGEYVYPNNEWTEVAPPEGIYHTLTLLVSGYWKCLMTSLRRLLL
ncbi:hypothetical protein BUY94_12220 [Mammaliicoccus fleurettii]|nr:hypothetical protein BUY94_12220 [Mammaliicoccus fleurettii]RIL48983.1 hypothetical protein BUY93_09710 [Mammaliicoccus fleurettii]